MSQSSDRYAVYDEPPGDFELPQKFDRTQWQLWAIGWSIGQLAHRLGVPQSKASAWYNGRSFIPNQVAIWLETLARMMDTMGSPPGWIIMELPGEEAPVRLPDMKTSFDEAPGEFGLPQKFDRTQWQLWAIGWSLRELSARLYVSQARVLAWYYGRTVIPDQVAIWLETMASFMENMVCPPGWIVETEPGRARHEQGVKLRETPYSTANYFNQEDRAPS